MSAFRLPSSSDWTFVNSRDWRARASGARPPLTREDSGDGEYWTDRVNSLTVQKSTYLVSDQYNARDSQSVDASKHY